ncbi:hypothetical protein BC829DRAFT_409311 [Chytridium lagenaria]|nr:hypothetical protein BC829DRAFT_409311 [Chytridium lagenaria]
MDTETSYLQSLPNSSPILKFSSPSPSLTTPSAASFQQSSAIILTSSAISPALSTLTTKLSRKRDFEDEESLAPPRKKIAEESKCTTSPRPISKPMTSHQKTPKLASLSGPCSPIPNFLPIPSYIIGEITLSTMDYTSISPLFGYSDMLNF